MKKRKYLTNAIVIAGIFVILAGYAGGYVLLRVNHDFVRDATYSTGSDGHLVPTDEIRLAGWDTPMHRILGVVYWPARWLEAMCWRAHRRAMDRLGHGSP